MKRFLLLLFLLVCLTSNAAVQGDITAASIETNGWVLSLTIKQFNTNSFFWNGFQTNNVVGLTNNLTVNFNAPGYNADSTTNLGSYKAYGTYLLHLPFGTNIGNMTAVTNDIQASGADAVYRIALSGPIFTNDSSVTVSLVAGGIQCTNGNTTNCTTTTGFTVVNNSYLRYSEVKARGNWTYPGWQLWTNATPTVQAFGYQWFADQGQPLACCRFVYQDGAHTPITNFQTKVFPMRGSTFGVLLTGTCAPRYVDTPNLSTFNANTNIRCDVTFYPRRGDATGIQDTFDEVNHWPTPKYCSITNWYDPNFAYCTSNRTWALVDPGAADDTGVAATNVPNWSAPPKTFQTINGALLAIKATNNAHFGHNDVGGGLVYLTNGASYNYPSGSGSYSAFPRTWVTVQRIPTATIDQVLVITNTGNQRICGLDKIQGVTLTNLWRNDSIGIFFRSQGLWFDQDKFNILSIGASSMTWREVTNIYVTSCTVNELYQVNNGQAFGQSGANAGSVVLVSDSFVNESGQSIPWIWIGNARTQTNVPTVGSTFLKNDGISGGSAAAIPDSSIVAYCDLRNMWWGTGAAMITLNNSTNSGSGVFFLGNLVEKLSGDGQFLTILAGDGLNAPQTNHVADHNTWLGQRVNENYNDQWTNNLVCCKLQNNYSDDFNIKSEGFAPGKPGRIGNWMAVWGVGYYGNVDGRVNGIGVPGDFQHPNIGGGNDACGFFGLNSSQYNPTNGPSWAGFMARGSFDGTNPGNGSGNYILSVGSPLQQIRAGWSLRYDIFGNCWGDDAHPGAVVDGAPRRAVMFF